MRVASPKLCANVCHWLNHMHTTLSYSPGKGSPAAGSGQSAWQQGPAAALRPPCAGRQPGHARGCPPPRGQGPSICGGVLYTHASARGGGVAAAGPGRWGREWRPAAAAPHQLADCNCGRGSGNCFGALPAKAEHSACIAGKEQSTRRWAGRCWVRVVRGARRRPLACSACAAAFRASGRRTAAAARHARRTPWLCKGAPEQGLKRGPHTTGSETTRGPCASAPASPVAPQHSRGW